MQEPICLDEYLIGQYSLEEYIQEDSADIPENGQGSKSQVRILRLVMTPTEGCELLKRLRNDPLVGNVPIIVLTH